jgi:uncharacterized repeat protein (TIGR01451 family)
MKNIIYTFKTYMLLVVLFATTLGYSQIVLNTSPNTSTCDLSGDNVTVLVPTEVLTGDNIALNITLSGDYDASCVKTVSITNSSNLVFQNSVAIPFTNMGGGTYQNDPTPTLNGDPGPLNGNEGYNFNVYYKFPNNTTCNGTVGTFDVTVTLDCAGVITTCTTSVSVIARAANYWTVTKEFVIGDLVCGTSKWRIKILNNNPNPSEFGNYSIQGTLTENISLPVVSNAVINISANDWVSYKYVTLQNCQNAGTQITNNIDYNFNLGNGCETMIGTATAISPPLQSPNASLAFTKSVFSYSGIYSNGNYQLSAGCSGVYSISIYNDGNVPWEINSITDVIPNDITITGISDTNWGGGYSGIQPSMWVNTPTITGQTYLFTPATSPYLLNPGDSKNIYFYFDVNNSVPNGTLITNNAQINYNAGSVGNNSGGSGIQCSGVNCPVIDQSIQNDTALCTFEVVAPFSKEIFRKCVTNQPLGNIYNIGDLVHFKYVIGNAGSGNLNTTITDNMALPNQNLQIVGSSISTSYYENNTYSINNWLCDNNFSNPQPITFPVTSDTSNLQDPSFGITGMPGICDLGKANYLVIEFDALILPQIYGNKVNTAYTDTQQSSASYTVDQIGVLEVNKYADQEIVENGGNFNYIIEVTNSGSVTLDNIVITDMLPDCVSVNGQINIEDAYATSIPFTTSGGLTINIDPTTEIFPGNDFTITIPVTKSGGGNCCNESVSVTAEMTTSGIELNANYGSPEAPAACVTGTECCDIEDFDASIQENNGTFNVNISGGSVPLQEVEISMVDYHIEYSDEACKPDDFGVFGTLTTSTTNLTNLILNAGDNGTSSLSWLLGDPSIINSAVNLDILYPDVLNLDCCNVEFYFCLKVRVKDVNCNVCEKIICFSSNDLDEPCEIDINPLSQDEKYCVNSNDTINLNWSDTGTTGQVTISLFDNTNSSIYGVLASGVPNTGSFTYTIPSSLPCDPARSWSIIVEDAEKNCFDRSDPFIIECCDDDCDCGEWLTNSVTIEEYQKEIPQDPKLKVDFSSNFTKEIDCGGQIKLKPILYYSFTAPNYVCNPEECDLSYKWEVIDTNNNVIQAGNGKTFNYNFSSYGNYQIVFTPICGGKKCEPCVIGVGINQGGVIEPNKPNTN